MDYDLYLKLAQIIEFKLHDLNASVARFRLHSLSKTSSQAVAFKYEILQKFDEFAINYPLLLPTGWRKSRRKYTYHLALDSAKSHANEKVSLYSFLQISADYLTYVWDYKFFWASLLAYCKPQTNLKQIEPID
jgi:hypothetical protein